ncbi:MAG: polysaccharide deacetylase family protein [bacterium]
MLNKTVKPKNTTIVILLLSLSFIILVGIITVYFFFGNTLKKLSNVPLTTTSIQKDILIQDEGVTKLDIKSLDIFPSNYEEFLKNNNISLTSHERTSLLRDGFVRFADDSSMKSNIYIPDELLKKAYDEKISDIQSKLMNTDLKQIADTYLDTLLIQIRSEKTLDSKYKSILDTLNQKLTTLKSDFDTTPSTTLEALSSNPKFTETELGILVYFTKQTNSSKNWATIYGLSNYLGHTLKYFDLYSTDKNISDSNIEDLDRLLNIDGKYPLKSSSSSVSSKTVLGESTEMLVLAPCIAKYVGKTYIYDSNETLKKNLDARAQILIGNLKLLDLPNAGIYTHDLKDTPSVISDYFCSKDLTNISTSNIGIYTKPNSSELIMGILPKELKQTEVSDNNFSESYDIEPSSQSKGSVRVPILMYHQIEDAPTGLSTFGRNLYVSPDSFEKHLAYLVKKNYTTITPKNFYELLKTGKNPTQKTIMLTFDDGTKNHYTNAYRLLKKYGLSGVFYVPSNKRGLTNAELKEMSDNGMNIDSHSTTHMDLQKEKNYSTLYSEVYDSKANLQSITGKEVESLAYPYCVANSTSISLVASAGYYIATSCGNSIDHYRNNRLTLSRVHANESMDEFKNILSGKR